MADNSVDEVLALLFDTATDTRKFEIELFWKRSLFFWGFISVTFAGFAAVKDSLLAMVLACFGLACSVIWTLGNRGGKYWQEAWEKKVERIEAMLPKSSVTNSLLPMFDSREPDDYTKGAWLRGRQFSVSKLTIALSDFTFLIWAALLVRSCAVIGKERFPDLELWGLLAEARKWGLDGVSNFRCSISWFDFQKRTNDLSVHYSNCLASIHGYVGNADAPIGVDKPRVNPQSVGRLDPSER